MLTVLALSLATTTGMVVLMPVEAPDVLPAMRAKVDGLVRQAAGAVLGGRLQPTADTDAVVADAVAAGLNCSLRDVACGVRIGAIAGASEVLLPAVETGPDGQLELTIKRLDVARARAVAVGATILRAEAGEPLGGVVATVLEPPATVAVEVDGAARGSVVRVDDVPVGELPLVAPVALTIGPHVVAVNIDGVDVHRRSITATRGFQRVSFTALVAPAPSRTPPSSRPAADGPSPLVVAGLVTAGVGGLAALGGGAVATATEMGLATPRAGAEGYEADRDFGRLMLATAVVGVVVAAGGAVLTLVGGGS